MAPFQFTLVVLFFLYQGDFGLAESNMTLKLVHVIFRHGEKVPHSAGQNYPNDPHGNHSYFPVDDGDLTNTGKLRSYKLGLMLRREYGEFFGQYYLPSAIYARSTDFSRTKMSLQLVLAALYPPVDKQIWNPHLLWLPVSATSAPITEDILLIGQRCPQYEVAKKKFYEDDTGKEILRKYKNVFEYISNHTGKSVTSPRDVLFLHNLLQEQRANNLTLPKWTETVYPNPMREITRVELNIRSITPGLQRFTGGPVLRQVIENVKALRNGQSPNRKAFLYSGHEFNVIGLARTMGLTEPDFPLHGSAIIIKIIEDENKKYYVKVVLWTGESEKLSTQQIPGCNEPCPLETFTKILDDVIPSLDEMKTCYENLRNSAKSSIFSSI